MLEAAEKIMGVELEASAVNTVYLFACALFIVSGVLTCFLQTSFIAMFLSTAHTFSNLSHFALQLFNNPEDVAMLLKVWNSPSVQEVYAKYDAVPEKAVPLAYKGSIEELRKMPTNAQ